MFSKQEFIDNLKDNSYSEESIQAILSSPNTLWEMRIEDEGIFGYGYALKSLYCECFIEPIRKAIEELESQIDSDSQYIFVEGMKNTLEMLDRIGGII